MPGNTNILVTAAEFDRLVAAANEPVNAAAIDAAYIEAIRRYPPLSDDELIEQTIEFANSGDAKAFELLWTRVRLSEEVLANLDAQHQSPKNSRPDDPRLPLIERERLALRERLTAIAGKRVTARWRDQWRRIAEGLVLVPTFDANGSRRYRHVVFEQFVLPPSPPIAYVLLRLLFGKPYRGNLCQCKFKDCGKFFLATLPKDGRGRTIRDYCPGTDHRDLAHKATAADRVRKSRRNRAIRRAMKQKRRP
jgi:hypothetical protein